MSKLSMVLFYIRIFPSRNFKRVLILVFAMVLLPVVIMLSLLVTECEPISYNWNDHLGVWKGRPLCRDVHATTVAYAVINTVQEASDSILLFVTRQVLICICKLNLGYLLTFHADFNRHLLVHRPCDAIAICVSVTYRMEEKDRLSAPIRLWNPVGCFACLSCLFCGAFFGVIYLPVIFFHHQTFLAFPTNICRDNMGVDSHSPLIHLPEHV